MSKKQMAKWKVKVSDDDIVKHDVYQMYTLDWFSKETMTKWEEINNYDKTCSNDSISLKMHTSEASSTMKLNSKCKKPSTM